MAKAAVAQHGVPISLACAAFTISETCYRYQAKRQAENDAITHWLERLTDNNRNWGFAVLPVLTTSEPSYGTTSGSTGFIGSWN